MNNLRNLRKAKGLSLPDLHKMTGYPLRSLENWDMEVKQIRDYHRIKRLAEILGCDVDDFMTKEEECLYEANNAVMVLIQEEDGVHITILLEDGTRAAFVIVSRDYALHILKNLKFKKEVSGYFKSHE